MPLQPGNTLAPGGRVRLPVHQARHRAGKKPGCEAVRRKDGRGHMGSQGQVSRSRHRKAELRALPQIFHDGQKNIRELHEPGRSLRHRRKLARRDREHEAVRFRQEDRRRDPQEDKVRARHHRLRRGQLQQGVCQARLRHEEARCHYRDNSRELQGDGVGTARGRHDIRGTFHAQEACRYRDKHHRGPGLRAARVPRESPGPVGADTVDICQRV